MRDKPLCIYHGGCDDGFAAAWVVATALTTVGDELGVDLYPGVYQKRPPDVTGRDVILVDFSYKRSVLSQMVLNAHSILILDHHKTAAEDLASLPTPPPSWSSWKAAAIDGQLSQSVRLAAIFDMDRSGAGLAWDFFIGGPRSNFISYIEDRDLWRKSLPGGDEFTIALRSYPQDLKVWTTLIASGAAALIEEGKSIQRYYRARVEEAKKTSYPARISGNACRVANAPYFLASEVAGELCDGVDFGACYFEAEQGRWQYSLRSRGDFDVSEIAKIWGGGGHKNAAGFSVSELVHEP